MTGPEGNIEISVIWYIARNSFNLIVMAVVNQHSQVTVHCYPQKS